jgi:hypothetical protein
LTSSSILGDTLHEPLWGLPAVLPFESPASWLSRAAQSVGVGIEEFVDYVGLDITGDLDVQFLSDDFWRLARRFGLSSTAFWEARRVMVSVRMLGRGGHRLLMTSDGRARYRICLRCCATQGTPHFGLQCRFDAWRCCPMHRCMMEDQCWHCGATVVLPFSPGIDGDCRVGCTSLAQCRTCGARWRRGPVADISSADSLFNEVELVLLSNGASLLAALFQRRVDMPGNRTYPLNGLRDLQMMGLLARAGYGPTAALWRERVEAQYEARQRGPAFGG